jgi:biopolymer transport protein ExbD
MRKPKEDADINITSFMNLMIVLVPVLLLNMVFTQTMVLDIKLPAAAAPQTPDKNKKKEVKFNIELAVLNNGMLVNVNQTVLGKFDKINGEHDFDGVSRKLRQIKNLAQIEMNKTLPEGEDFKFKKDILLLLNEGEEYSTIVTAMDTLRSYPKKVLAKDSDRSVDEVRHVELLPDISLGDVPKPPFSPDDMNVTYDSLEVKNQ